MLIPHDTLIALADGENFKLFRNTGNEAAPKLTRQPSPKLGALNHSGGSHHSSAGNHADRLADEDAHAGSIAQWLNAEAVGHRIAALIVIAPPRTLGELRKHYGKQLEACLLGELHKDLIGKPDEDLLAALREVR